MDGAIDDFSPGAAFRSGRAAIIEADDDVTGLGDGAIVIVVPCAPFVQDGLRRRFSIDVDEDGIFFGGIEMRRLEHPGVEGDAFADVHLEEFGGRGKSGATLARSAALSSSTRAE